jgi:integrase
MVSRGPYLTANTLSGLEMPARDEKARDRIAPPKEAQQLLDALSGAENCYPCDALDLRAGALRRAARLRARAAGLAVGRARSRPSARAQVQDEVGHQDAADRQAKALRPILRREWLRQGKPSAGRVVRGPNGGAVDYNKQCRRVGKAWEAATLERITPHEGRHTFASYLIA